MNTEKDNYNVLFDSAILCSVMYGVLYFFVYIHEKVFLEKFDINIDFIEVNNLSIIKNLAPIIFVYIFSFYLLYTLKNTFKIKTFLYFDIAFLFVAPEIFLIAIYKKFILIIILFINLTLLFIQGKKLKENKKFSEIIYIIYREPLFYLFILFILFFSIFIKDINIENYKFAIISENVINDEKIYKDILLRKYNSFFIIKTFDVKNKKFCDGFKIINADTYDNLNILYYQRGKDLWKITYK